ncbi:hypothetical protein [Nannocystis punicea]|uniref:Uncharacterized protein n=1 Tax=Nannocystis punicea TaxID=2995304 RepID=A0ABY7GSL5_9BACT|nr:hypothetical protein [Nannocystis poenicansa]WAS89946.1 hypothetical protein O0S08_27450 [Nannocystis poenicansa]
MLLASTCALLALLVAPAAAPGVASDMSPGTYDAPTGEPQEFRAARADITGFDEAAVLAALRLRLPRLPIERHGGPVPTETPHLYLQLGRAADERGTIRVITSDGRAYERSFAIEIGQEVRVAASTAANLIFAVEQGAVAPDQEDVAIPPPVATAAPEPTPAPEPAPPPVAEPPPDRTEATGPSEQVQKDMSDKPRWELGLGLQAAVALGLGSPAYAGPLAGGGGGLGLEVRSPRGFAAALETRAIGQTAAGVGLGRLRVAIAAGYALRRGRFELPILVGLAIEPWWITREGERAPLFAAGDDDRLARPPLLGGFLRLSPGFRARPSPWLGLRVGPRIELGGSFVVDDHDGARVVGLADVAGVPRFRVGGLELSLGLELALQFGLPSR